jgi:hypothetical protein
LLVLHPLEGAHAVDNPNPNPHQEKADSKTVEIADIM